MPNSNTPGQIVTRPPVSVGGNTPPGPGGEPGGSGGSSTPLILTKFQFRKLFTLAERMKIDNLQYSSSTPATVKAAVATMQMDLNVSGEVDLHLPDTISGVRYLASVGLITTARADRILANLAPLTA